jgi:hypothetical protein
MADQKLRVRDARTLPFIWISRVLLERYALSWKGILAYTAVAYHSHSATGSCRNVGIRQLAKLVGVSETTMKEGLSEVEEKKAIKVKAYFTKLKNGKRLRHPNEYVLVDLNQNPGDPI